MSLIRDDLRYWIIPFVTFADISELQLEMQNARWNIVRSIDGSRICYTG